MISKEDVLQIAKLARLSIKEDELDRFTEEFNSVLEYVEQLEEVDVSKVEPMSHVHGVQNVFRDDELVQVMTTEEALQNAPDRSPENYIKVPIIIDRSGEH